MKNTKYFKNEDLKAKETQEIKTKGEKFPEDLFCKKIKKKIKKYFFWIDMKQTIGNACGTIGIIHSVLNNASDLKLKVKKKNLSLKFSNN